MPPAPPDQDQNQDQNQNQAQSRAQDQSRLRELERQLQANGFMALPDTGEPAEAGESANAPRESVFALHRIAGATQARSCANLFDRE